MNTILNPHLVEKQGLTEDDVAELEHLHTVREKLFAAVEQLDPGFQNDSIQLYAALLESLEFDMQRVWKFPQDRSFHSWWYRMPHCQCPQMDNADPIYAHRIISGNCPVHSGK